MNIPWIEKYRPESIDDIIGNKNINQQFKNIIETNNIPHMLLVGVPGTGKTTSILCLAKSLLGNNFNESFMELNASDERGIDVIRNKITTFCKKKVNNSEYKIIFLDEVDYMTSIAQQALRRIIELYTSSTRFIMACNSSSNIIEAIQSRCVLIRFSQIENHEIIERLKYICNNELLPYTDEGLLKLIEISNGDMRRAINNLQSVSITFNEVTENNILNIINMPNIIIVNNLIKMIMKKDIDKSIKIVEELLCDGHSAQDIIQYMFNNIKDSNIDDNLKLNILKNIGKIQMYIVSGGEPKIQLLALIAKIIILE